MEELIEIYETCKDEILRCSCKYFKMSQNISSNLKHNMMGKIFLYLSIFGIIFFYLYYIHIS